MTNLNIISLKSIFQTLSSGDYTLIKLQPFYEQCKQQILKLSELKSLSNEQEEALLDVGLAFDKMWDLKEKGSFNISIETDDTKVFLELTRLVVKLCERSQVLASAIFKSGIIKHIASDLCDWHISFKLELISNESSIVFNLTLNYLRIIVLIARFENIKSEVINEARGINLPDIVETHLGNLYELTF